MSFSVSILLHAMGETLGISVPAVARAQLGLLTKEQCDRKLERWSKRLLKRANVQLIVSGQEHIARLDPPFIVISNHQSLYDIPVWLQALPFSVRMAAKKELFSVPIWGRAMQVAGFVQIDRKDRQRAHEALAAAGEQMRSDQVSLVIAPEGTRTTTGELLPFRKGAFSLSQTTGIPILPVAINGTMRVHKSGDLVVHRGQTVSVKILEPLWPGNYRTVEDFRDAGQTAIREALTV